MALPPFYAYLISVYGWRNALILISAINMHLVVSSCLFRPLKAKSVRKQTEEEQSNNLEMQSVDYTNQEHKPKLVKCCTSASKASGIPELCYTAHYPIVVFIAFMMGAALYCTIIYFASMVLQHGFTKRDSSLILSFFGMGSLAGRFIHGILIDLKYASTHATFFVSLIISSISLLLSPLMTKFALLAIFAVIYGITSGIISPLIYVIAREVAPAHLLAPVIGFTVLLLAAGNAFGTVAGGWLYDISSDYGVLFYASGGMMGIAAILFIPTLIWLHRRKQNVGI